MRALIGFVEIYVFTGVPAFFSALLSSRGKRLGDYAAGTYVVRDRVRLRLPPPALMPPPLAGWARTADIAALPDRPRAGRAPVPRPAAGDRPAVPGDHRRAGSRTRCRSTSRRPRRPGTPPEAYLAAVIASRRERDQARLAREAELRRRLTARR